MAESLFSVSPSATFSSEKWQEDGIHKVARYNSHPSGVEAIEICRDLNFNLGNVFKYVFRREHKEALRSLKAALYYFKDHQKHSFTQNPVKFQKQLLQQIYRQETDRHAQEFYMSFYSYLENPTTGNSDDVEISLLNLIQHAEPHDR